jgi:tetratricopeptide (TPR) repeat protein
MPFRPLAPVRLILCAVLALAAPAAVAEDAGAYLAARVAGANSDYRAASAWFTRALLADPKNPALMDGAIISHLSAGNLEAATAVAQRMAGMPDVSQAARLAILADQMRREDYAATLADLAKGPVVSPLLDDLARAWAEAGAGRMTEALEQFDAIVATDGQEAFGLYHKALALALVGDLEGADAILAGSAAGPLRLMTRGTIAHAEILSQLGRNKDALALLDRSFPGEPTPPLTALRGRLEAGEALPLDAVRTARDGMAEVFFTLAAALNGEAESGYTLLFARAATYLRPDHADAAILTAGLLEEQGQYALAVETYAAIPQDDPGYMSAEIGRARALEADDKPDAGIEVLRALARSMPGVLVVQVALGDALRRAERFPEAAAAYDAAVALVAKPEARHWGLFYSRAIARERQGLWDQAEPDFRKALDLNPDQPQVLNYFGYSLLERHERLDEALGMIERAVRAEPDAGYIVDSLAWALYRLGRHAEAVEPMERASVLEPVDPVVTDHLGDVYWAVGRQMEARFQWRRALSFDPEEKDAVRIRRKLEVGLDAVLAEEGMKPLTDVANDGGN